MRRSSSSDPTVCRTWCTLMTPDVVVLADAPQGTGRSSAARPAARPGWCTPGLLLARRSPCQRSRRPGVRPEFEHLAYDIEQRKVSSSSAGLAGPVAVRGRCTGAAGGCDWSGVKIGITPTVRMICTSRTEPPASRRWLRNICTAVTAVGLAAVSPGRGSGKGGRSSRIARGGWAYSDG
jgi:hypothetical protein